jgi:DNA-binding winged helix-turn-helix (wHTH) protein
LVYQFHQFTLDTRQYQLFVSGKAVPMEPLVFDLLVYLIEHRDRVVTREELLNNLWQGKIVTDSALAARLKDARKAVQDSGTKQQIIKTIHGRGYQFIAVVADATSGHIPEKSKRDLFGEKIPLPEKPSIAILPFRSSKTCW